MATLADRGEIEEFLGPDPGRLAGEAIAPGISAVMNLDSAALATALADPAGSFHDTPALFEPGRALEVTVISVGPSGGGAIGISGFFQKFPLIGPTLYRT